MRVKHVIYPARVAALLLILGNVHAVWAQRTHICCTVEDCKDRQITPNLQLTKAVHLSGSLVDQSGAPFKGSKVSLRRWISPASQTAFKTVITDANGRFDLGTIDPGQYRFLPSETGAFQQPSHVECSQTECHLNLILRATGTDTAESICPIL